MLGWQKELFTRSFKDFVPHAWHVVESNSFKGSWSVDAVCDHLQAVTAGDIRRLVIVLPPGTSKSLLVSTLWPAWDWITAPERRFLFASYVQSLSDKSARLHRDLILSPWYSQRFPHVEIAKTSVQRTQEFANTRGGWRFSTSKGGQITGRHADVLAFDDLAKSQDANGHSGEPLALQESNDFWFRDCSSRRADPMTTRYVGVAQRLHHEDTVGRCIEIGYTALVLPMEFDPRRKCVTTLDTGKRFFEDPRTEANELLVPDRYPREECEAQKASMGTRAYEAQYNQNPSPASGGIFQEGWFQTWTARPEHAKEILVVDAAFKDSKRSDYVVVAAWAEKGGHYYLLDLIHDRLNVLATMDAIREMSRRFPRAIGKYVEDKANGPAIVQTLKDELPGIQEWSPGSASKESRAQAIAPLFESKRVWLPAAPWIERYRQELLRFPTSKHDDMVDATSMALLILHKPRAARYGDAVKQLRAGVKRG